MSTKKQRRQVLTDIFGHAWIISCQIICRLERVYWTLKCNFFIISPLCQVTLGIGPPTATQVILRFWPYGTSYCLYGAMENLHGNSRTKNQKQTLKQSIISTVWKLMNKSFFWHMTFQNLVKIPQCMWLNGDKNSDISTDYSAHQATSQSLITLMCLIIAQIIVDKTVKNTQNNSKTIL